MLVDIAVAIVPDELGICGFDMLLIPEWGK